MAVPDARSTLFPASPTESGRRLPIGAELTGAGRVHFRVWAPAASSVAVAIGEKAAVPLGAVGEGYWEVEAAARPGDTYLFRLDDHDELFPDPASRFQPQGPHGPSQIVDPAGYRWNDADWTGRPLAGQVIYELHVGTFTPEGTYAAAAAYLDGLRDLGITTIELMPLAEFDGRFGWGYDGVDLFAPFHAYGSPDDLRAFVDRAHGAGLGVILDVVYNHLGPSGNCLRAFSPSYFSARYENEWGEAINFDGPDAGPVREFFIANARYWIDEFHMDGLRLDATQQIFDDSSRHILTEIGVAMREAAGGRVVFAVAENEPQLVDLIATEQAGGMGLDGLWNDDFHHSAMVALTGRAEAYYTDTAGTPQELIAAAKYGYLFQGQHYSWQQQVRGTPDLNVDPARFIVYLQNHDQVANSVRGLRMHEGTDAGRVRALTALLLLMPGTPMLFQGQEFAASTPFLYFADHEPDLTRAVRSGRRTFLSQFPSALTFMKAADIDDPGDERTFRSCVLDHGERERHAEVYALHRDLLRLRRDTPAFAALRRGVVDGTVLSARAFALRYMMGGAEDRLLLVNLGGDLTRASIADPLIAPPRDCGWRVEWASEAATYGGSGTPDLWPGGGWRLPAESAIVLAPGPVRHGTRPAKPVLTDPHA